LRWLIVLAVTLAVAATPGAARPTGAEFDACDAAVRESPEERASYQCYWVTARRLQAWPEAVRRLDALLAVEPDNHLAMLFLGAIEADRNHDRAETLYRSAIETFVAGEDHPGEVLARVSLSMFLAYRQRHAEAAAELEAAETAALASGDAILIARLRTRQGWQAFHGDDYGRAWVFFQQARDAAFPEGPTDLQAQVLDGLAATAWATGEYRYALDSYRREAEILGLAGDVVWEADVRANIALLASQPAAREALTREELRDMNREAVDAAVRAGNRRAEIRTRGYLGQTLSYPENVAEFRKAVEIAREVGLPGYTCEALNHLAFGLLVADDTNAEEALALSDEAIELARTRSNPSDLASARATRARLERLVGRRDEAIVSGLAALDAIERVRELQPDGSVRAAVFSRWASAYYGLADHVLETRGSDGVEGIDLAFGIVERMRARVLLDALDRAGASAVGDTDLPSRARWSEKLEEIASAQRRILRRGMDEAGRRAALDELERLELDERVLRDAVAREDAAFAMLRAPRIPRVIEIQDALTEDQALLSFQVASDLSGPVYEDAAPTWLIVVTSENVRAYSLPREREIRLAAHMFLGLLSRRDESVATGAAHLYGILFEKPLGDLPAEIERLVIVPDGILHQVPFGALRATASEEPLLARFRISRVPSATLWLRWQRERQRLPPGTVLALADPDLPTPERKEASRRAAGAFAEYLGLGPLPRARDEAREVVRRLGGDSLMVVGTDASEALLKSESGRGFRVLHVAAHAVIDGRHPARSALVLCPGDESEDGLLQIREIVNLDLEGTVVFLSACSSASGPVVAGEGVMGIARAFFQAGAPAVIGTLWPLRDDEAAELAGDFARHLSRGEPLGQALGLTQVAWITRGEPEAAWSGTVLLGNGDLILFDTDASRRGRTQLVSLLLVGAAGIVGVSALLWWMRRR
jgi:CHAT domain-containing protein